jgi:hypothetical protein
VRRLWIGAVLCVAALPSCGSSDDAGTGDTAEVIPPAAWAEAVCTEVGAAAEDLEAALAVIDELPVEVEADAPLGDVAGPLRDAFLSLPTYIDRYRTVVESTSAPDTPDGQAFRREVLEDLNAAGRTFGEAATRAETLDGDTTAEGFFGGAQAFADFPEAFASADLDFGDDVPPGIAAALTGDRTCAEVQGRLQSLIGGQG